MIAARFIYSSHFKTQEKFPKYQRDKKVEKNARKKTVSL